MSTKEALQAAREALERIASWPEGDTVGGHFDEPASAQIARDAISKIDAALAEQPEPMHMFLCEARRLVLRVGQPYVFRPVAGCATCDEMAKESADAYGPSMGEPAQQDEPNRVRIPTSEEEAAGMVLVGSQWLSEHAPHRLRQQPEPSAQQDERAAFEVWAEAQQIRKRFERERNTDQP
jgi:hypothetical protein